MIISRLIARCDLIPIWSVQPMVRQSKLTPGPHDQAIAADTRDWCDLDTIQISGLKTLCRPCRLMAHLSQLVVSHSDQMTVLHGPQDLACCTPYEPPVNTGRISLRMETIEMTRSIPSRLCRAGTQQARSDLPWKWESREGLQVRLNLENGSWGPGGRYIRKKSKVVKLR